MKVLALVLVWTLVTAFAKTPSSTEAVALLKHIDEMYRADTSETELTMQIQTAEWTRQLKLRGWSWGMDKTLIRILAPKKDEGVSTLRIDREMWNYFPKINQVVKVPPSMMMGSWMGSDFTNDDLVRESSLVDDYDVTMKSQDETHLLTLTPKRETPSVWGRIEIKVEKNTKIPQQQIYYDERGRKIRIMELRDVKEMGGRRIPTVIELRPLNKPGQSTTVTYESAKFNHKIDESVFTLRNLQRR